jgi:hypothetical protein
MTLMGYRLRPLPRAALVGLTLALLVVAWWLAPHLGALGAARFMQFASVLLGLGAGFTVSRDIDPEPVLASAPHPYWRTPAVRAALWLLGSGAVIVLIGAIIGARVVRPLPVDHMTELAIANLVFVAGLVFLSSLPWGSLLGGAVALGGIGACAILQRLWAYWPLRVIDDADASRVEHPRVWLWGTGAACLVAGLLYLRGRGFRVGHLLTSRKPSRSRAI